MIMETIVIFSDYSLKLHSSDILFYPNLFESHWVFIQNSKI